MLLSSSTKLVTDVCCFAVFSSTHALKSRTDIIIKGSRLYLKHNTFTEVHTFIYTSFQITCNVRNSDFLALTYCYFFVTRWLSGKVLDY